MKCLCYIENRHSGTCKMKQNGAEFFIVRCSVIWIRMCNIENRTISLAMRVWVCRHDSPNITWLQLQFATKMLTTWASAANDIGEQMPNQINHFVQPYPNFECSPFSLFLFCFVFNATVIFIFRCNYACPVHCVHSDTTVTAISPRKKDWCRSAAIYYHCVECIIFLWKYFIRNVVENSLPSFSGIISEPNCVCMKYNL